MSTALWIQCFGEMVGVMILILLGNGACFATSHSKMFANGPGKWVIIVMGWSFGILVGAMVASAFGAPAHINSAVTVYQSFSDYKVLAFIPFQFIGAFLGQLILDFLNWKFIVITSEEDKFATRSAHCTNPSIQEGNNLRNFAYEFIGTSILIGIIFITNIHFQTWTQTGGTFTTVLLISITAMAILTSLGSATGAALNPIRDLAPRILYSVLRIKMGTNLATANWSYSWIPVSAPLLSGLIFGLASLAL